jgi:hypothetical protein
LGKSLQLFHLYLELSEDRKVRFSEKLIPGSPGRAHRGFRRAAAAALAREFNEAAGESS